MNILSISILSVLAVIIIVMLRPKNGEIALMLGIATSIIILFSVISQVTTVLDMVNSIIAVSDISTSYIVILLKVIGISLLTEFAVNTCKDAGSQSLANNISLAGKIMITITSLPLYADILNVVLSLVKR